jgi:uncharacterized membrane protein YdjX (TVP38/TMEM64 family)
MPPDSPFQALDSPTDEARLTAEARASWQKENRRIIILAVGVAAFMAIAHFTPLRVWITNVQLWKEWIRDLGWLAHAAFCCLCALAVMIGVPRLSLCAMAGLLFGFAEGMALSLLGSLLGSYAAFFVARKGGRRAVLARASRWPWLQPLLGQPSLVGVFWIRQLMLPGVVLNVLLGVSRVSHTAFLGGTLFGYLPLNAAFSLVGSGLGKDNLARSLVHLLTAAALIHIIGWVVWRLMAARKGQ